MKMLSFKLTAAIVFHYVFFLLLYIMKVNGCRQLFDFQDSSQYLLLCSREEKTHTGLEQLKGEYSFGVNFPFNHFCGT